MTKDGFILVWTETDDDWFPNSDRVKNHYMFCEDKKDADKEYKRLLDLNNLYSLSMCAVIKSTDYDKSREVKSE